MFTALALAAIIVTNPASCPSGMWATPAGESGYSCTATPPRSETWWLPAPPKPPVHHTPVHHAKPKHHAPAKHHPAPKGHHHR